MAIPAPESGETHRVGPMCGMLVRAKRSPAPTGTETCMLCGVYDLPLDLRTPCAIKSWT